ncbi:MAG: response regulator transcription factor [Prevotella sp.]|nr:response regulator transcription factor [Prevotella sp.]
MKKYILADNQELTCYALQSLLGHDEQNQIFRSTDKAGLLQLLKEHESAIVILDYTLFDFNDVESLIITSERFAMASWVLVSEELTKEFLQKTVYASHAFSVVFKDEPMRVIREAIQTAADSKRYVSQQAMEVILSQAPEQQVPNVLTLTETEVAKAIALGKTTKEIASERQSSIHTINTHRKNIFRKLDINTAHELTRYALRAGWIDASEFCI